MARETRPRSNPLGYMPEHAPMECQHWESVAQGPKREDSKTKSQSRKEQLKSDLRFPVTPLHRYFYRRAKKITRHSVYDRPPNSPNPFWFQVITYKATLGAQRLWRGEEWCVAFAHFRNSFAFCPRRWLTIVAKPLGVSPKLHLVYSRAQTLFAGLWKLYAVSGLSFLGKTQNLAVTKTVFCSSHATAASQMESKS